MAARDAAQGGWRDSGVCRPEPGTRDGTPPPSRWQRYRSDPSQRPSVVVGGTDRTRPARPRDVGTLPRDLIVGLTTLPAAALPVGDGQVVITRDGSSGGVRPQDGGEFPRSLGPGELQALDLALEGTPSTEDRVIFCNGPGEYEQGRYATLRFDR